MFCRRENGSFTVEASILMPFIIFLIMACIYMLFFLHDKEVMQSYSMRKAEQLLWQENQNEEVDLLMMTVEEISSDKGMGFIGSYASSEVAVSGRMKVGLAGSSVFTGKQLETSVSSIAKRTDYVSDWYKTMMIQRLKK
jgi:Flp pilus assembly protein TadG